MTPGPPPRLGRESPPAPGELPHVPAPPDDDAAWFVAQPDAVQQASVRCPLRTMTPGRGCCGADAPVCTGGPRDGQVVYTLDCARCAAAGLAPGIASRPD